MIKLVAAGNYEQAKYWARELGWTVGEWRYMHSRQQLMGRPLGTEVHYVGLWYAHPSQKIGAFRDMICALAAEGRIVLIEHDADTGVST